MARDEFLDRNFTIQKLPDLTKRRKEVFICNCGWEGSYFEAVHFTIEEINALKAVLTDKGKESFKTWNGCVCPKCNSIAIISIEEALDRARRYIKDTIIENGWEENSIFPIAFRFIHTNQNGQRSSIV